MGLYLLFSSIYLKWTIEKLSQLDTDGELRSYFSTTLKIERLKKYFAFAFACMGLEM